MLDYFVSMPCGLTLILSYLAQVGSPSSVAAVFGITREVLFLKVRQTLRTFKNQLDLCDITTS